MTERSRIQTLIQVFVSAQTFAAMETESRTWKVKCPNCNHERSIWEMGGIRYKAASVNKKCTAPARTAVNAAGIRFIKTLNVICALWRRFAKDNKTPPHPEAFCSIHPTLSEIIFGRGQAQKTRIF